jgi:hypothetical protein
MIHIFTITARNYLSLALTLGDSVARHHPEARFTVCVADGVDGIPTTPRHPGHQFLDVVDLLPQEALDDLAFKYNITEFCTAVKPAVFRRIFDSEPATSLVYYLDPDTHLYGRLDPIVDGSTGKTLYLAPHLLDCRVADDHPYPEYKHLWEGIFNLGFCAIRRTAAAERVLQWWDARLRDYCYADFTDGLHTDQKWMDYAPAFFRSELQVVDHYGVNTAHWNLGERRLSERNGATFANDDSLIFFHFSGFDFTGKLLTKHVPPERQGYFDGVVRRLADDYRAAVIANGYHEFIAIPYRFGCYTDGLPVTALQRRIYRAEAKRTPIAAPFDAAGVFRARLRDAGLLDASVAGARNHSAATLPGVDRLTRTADGILRLFLRLFGARRYAYLIKFFGRYGRLEQHAFLLRARSE